jgi:folate-dependent phosphoribosylglycinamide formyltransferase PurN
MQQYSFLNLARHAARGNRGWKPAWRRPRLNVCYDVLVIGGGTAGLRAAIEAARAGARVVLADQDRQWGGEVVSNHETQRRLVEWHGLPFHHLPVEPGCKEQQEEKLLVLLRDGNADLLVLARYMQILTDRTCRELAGRAINIHHSFSAGLQGREAVPPGVRTRGQADRCNRALRQQ